MKHMEILGGIVAGAFLGTAFGLLIAPDEGSETRKKIISEAEQRAEKITGDDQVGKFLRDSNIKHSYSSKEICR